MRAWVPAEGRWVGLDRVAERLAGADWVLLGEVHDSEQAHRLQARLIEALHARGKNPTVVMEQIVRGQPAASDADRRAAMEAGGWPVTRYVPLLEVLQRSALPVRGGNLEAATLRDPARIPAAIRALDQAHPLSDPARKRLAERIDQAHCGMADARTVERLVELQALRDAALARSLLEAGSPAVLVAGNGHVRRDFGVPRFLPGRVLSVGLIEHSEEEAPLPQQDSVRAGAWDFVLPIAPVSKEDPCTRFRRQLEQMRRQGGAH